MRQKLIKNYLADQEVYEVIGHHLLVYIKTVIWYLLLLVAVLAIHQLVLRWLENDPIMTRIVAGIGVIIYIKCLYDLANSYLDALVLTDRGLLLFTRNGLFSYKTIAMQWVSLETVTDEQSNFMDVLFKKGDITIRLEEEQHLFTDVPVPSQQVATILTRRDRIVGNRTVYENAEPEAKDKYELLVEALGEVVSEYVEKKERDMDE